MSRFTRFRLGTLLSRRKEPVLVVPGKKYKRITIGMNGTGVRLRDVADGASIGTERQFIATEGQFVLSKIDARNGAFGVVPHSCNGAIITGNFWLFDVDNSLIETK